MIALILAMLTVILGSALASGTEAALFSSSPVKVQQLAEKNVRGARMLLHIRQNMSRPISTIVIMNNIFNIVGSIVVGSIAGSVLGSEWLGVISGVLTFLVIIFAEIIPKTLGERYAVQIGLLTAAPVSGLTWLMFPLVWLVEQLVKPITHGPPRQATNEAEIKLLAQIGQREGSIEGDEATLIQRVFRLNDSTAGTLMTPRVSLTHLYGDRTLNECRDAIIESPHSRILIVGEGIDDMLGVALKSELLIALIHGGGARLLASMARDPLVVPEMVRADKLLDTFRERKVHLAVVIDEFGGVSGVVTLEDVLEVLTGEIVDETDQVVDMQEVARQRRESLLARMETFADDEGTLPAAETEQGV